MAPTARRTMGGALAALLAGVLAGGCIAHQEAAQRPEFTPSAVGVAPGDGRPASLEGAASSAMARITSARDALEKEQVSHAQELLEASLADMDHLFTWLPEEPLYGAVDTAVTRLEREGGEVELGPLEERVLARQDSLPPEVVVDVQTARRLLGEGRRWEALGRLREAREVLSSELLVLPLDESRARVRHAVKALRAAQPALALSWLENVPMLLEEVRIFSPLVPARWQVRAAAAAAARGEWGRAEALLRGAVERLERYHGTMESPLTLRVERLEAEARLFLRMMDGRSRPSADELLWLAERMNPGASVGGSGSF